MANKRHKPEEIVSKLRPVAPVNARGDRHFNNFTGSIDPLKGSGQLTPIIPPKNSQRSDSRIVIVGM